MKALEHHTDHAGAAYIINEMIERMKMIRNASAMFVALTLFLLALPVSASGENVTHNFVSVCGRTEQVNVAIQ